MTKMNQPRLYPLAGVANLRDMGGWPDPAKRRVRPGLLFRSAQLSQADKREQDFLRYELGIKHIVDFRDSNEAELQPDPRWPGVTYHHWPALPQNWSLEPDPEQGCVLSRLWQEDQRAFFLQLYRVLGRSPATAAAYAQFFSLLESSPNQPVLWHCSQGKDRAGLAALLLLLALGLDWSQAEAEYLLTNRLVLNQYRALLTQDCSPAELERGRSVIFVRRENLAAWRSQIHRSWDQTGEIAPDGGPSGEEFAAYLQRGLGLDRTRLDRLRQNYLQA